MGGLEAARERARALLPTDMTERAFMDEVVRAAIEGGKDDATTRMQAERIARHAWAAVRPRLAKGKPIA